MWEKCAQYLKKIGSVILFASIIIWFLGYYPRPDGNSADLANPSATEVSATGATVQMESIAAERSYNGSYLERIGKFCEPVLEPLGLNWKSGVALISGAAAKEIIVSTFGVLYADSGELEGQGEINLAESVGEDEDALLRKQLIVSEDFTTSSAVAFMIFALLYFPCIATLAAIANETGSWKWALFSFVYSCSLAWLLSFLAYNISNLFS